MVKTIAVLPDGRISWLSIALLLPFLTDDQVPQRWGRGNSHVLHPSSTCINGSNVWGMKRRS
jgi:hypothetical protein